MHKLEDQDHISKHDIDHLKNEIVSFLTDHKNTLKIDFHDLDNRICEISYSEFQVLKQYIKDEI